MSESSTPYPPTISRDSTSPATPSEGIHFTPRRAMASFDNLVALANHQERLREARKMVWRDRGEPVVELDTLGACATHAATGGLRSATLAFNIRASVNIILALFRIHKVPRETRLRVIRHAIFGLDSWRFAAMLGTFTSLYKFLINALPIVIPAINPSKRYTPVFDDDDDLESAIAPVVEVPISTRTARLSLSTHAQLALIRKKTRRWHAALAGSFAGALAIMWEKRSRRAIIAQQMFVRGLQGSYNSFSDKHNIHVPHGAVLVFTLACGQIMYAFLMRPDTLPRSYTGWIHEASKVPVEGVHINRELFRNGTLDVAKLDNVLSLTDITSFNLTDLLSLRSLVLPDSSSSITSPTYTSLPPYAPCAAIHPALTSCMSVPVDRFFTVFKWMLPIYGALHLVPAILFKRKAFILDPGKVLMKAGWGSMRSSAFLGVFVIIYQSAFCYKHYLYRVLSASTKLRLPQPIINALVSKASYWFLGFLSGLSLFVEERRRRGDLAMYVLPKGLESLWVMLRGKGLVFRTGNWGEMALTAFAMGMVMNTYQNDPQHLSGLVRRILYQFIGPN